MSFEFGPQRIEKIEKKKNRFKEFAKEILYDNIIEQILLFITSEYHEIKTYLKTQFEYYKYLNQDNNDAYTDDYNFYKDGYNDYNDFEDTDTEDSKNHVNIIVYQYLLKIL